MIRRNITIAGATALALVAGGGVAYAASSQSTAKTSPVGIDRGVITVTEENAASGGVVFQCSEADTAGPDAASITVVAADNGCLIKGLSATSPFQLTPDGLNSPSLGIPYSNSAAVYGGIYAGLRSDEIGDLVVTFGYQDGGPPAPGEFVTPLTGIYEWSVMLP